MLFHEIYGCYYNTVAKILTEAADGKLSAEAAKKIVDERVFSKDLFTVLPTLKNECRQLLDAEGNTPLRYAIEEPLTALEKRWLKAISLDPRVQLFGVDFQLPPDIKPLFTQDDYKIYDKAIDGDDYGSEQYRRVFSAAVEAIRERRRLRIRFSSGKGNFVTATGVPYRIEYSEKDDKFRILMAGCRMASVVNVEKIEDCEVLSPEPQYAEDIENAIRIALNEHETKKYFVTEIVNECNVFERVMAQFARFEKEAEKISDKKYRVKIYYDPEDEEELVVTVLSFGSFVRVIEPISFVGLIVERLKKQRVIMLRENR